MSINTLCQELNLDISQYYRYMRKESKPYLTTVIKIADYFCCSIDYLLAKIFDFYLFVKHKFIEIFDKSIQYVHILVLPITKSMEQSRHFAILGLAPYLSDDKLNYTPPFNVAFTQILNEYGVSRYQLFLTREMSCLLPNNTHRIGKFPYACKVRILKYQNAHSIIRLTKYFNCTIDKLLGRDYQ